MSKNYGSNMSTYTLLVAELVVCFSLVSYGCGSLRTKSSAAQSHSPEKDSPQAETLGPEPMQNTRGIDMTSIDGVDPTGKTASDAGFRDAFQKACAERRSLYLPKGLYKLTKDLVWDFSNCFTGGVGLVGESHRETIIEFEAGGFTWTRSGAKPGTGPIEGGSFPYVFFELGKLFIHCKLAKVCFALGNNAGQDFFGSGNVHDMYVSNTYASDEAVALRINNVGATVFTNVQAGATTAYAPDYQGSDARPGPGMGTAVQMTMAAFNTFQSLSAGNSRIGIEFTDVGDSRLGFNYGNVFSNVNIENVQWAIVAANTANSATTKNTFIGGQIYTIYPGGALVANKQQSALGCCGNFTLQNINDGLNPLYQGSESPSKPPFIHPDYYKGIQVLGFYPVANRAIELRGSGDCTVNPEVNKTGQTQMVTVTGGVFSAVCWRGLTLAISGTYTFPWEPGDRFGVTYTVKPTVYSVPFH